MNYKALAAGAVLGFLMAVAPACGGGEDECGPNNCAGCCSADGVCTETAAQTAQACGASGNACVACAANQTCVGGACVVTTQPKPDAGTDAGTTCQGCRTSTGICLPGNAATNCGSGGAACQACTTAQTCGVPVGGTGNTCYTPVVVVSPVGKACTDATACSDLGTGAECRTQSADGGYTYQDGFCTKACANNTDCGDAGVCGPFSFQELDGGARVVYETDSICVNYCTPATQTAPESGCRAGYYCQALSQGRGVCVLDVPAPDGKIGQACTKYLECAYPPTRGFCQPETSNGQPTGWQGGMCLADCLGMPEGYCGAGSICTGFSAQEAYCLAACNTPGTGRGNCRTGYTCFALQSGTDGVCFPACDTPGNSCDTGQTCDVATGFCLLPDGGTP